MGQRESVRGLVGLYSVVVALALTDAVSELIDNSQVGIPLRLEMLPYFMAFFVTLIPFYHGALRHLDKTYIEERGVGVRRGALLVDFFLLFIEGAIFVAISALLDEPSWVAWGIAFLLTFDALWGIGAHYAFTQRGTQKAELRWAYTNLVWTAAMVIWLSVIGILPGSKEEPWALGFGLVAFTFTRTIVDYWWSWDFYYPSSNDDV